MTPALITHEISAKHDVPQGHPERPERYAAILDHIGDDYQSWQRVTAPLAKRDQLEMVHSKPYLDMIIEVVGNADEPAPLDAALQLWHRNLLAQKLQIKAIIFNLISSLDVLLQAAKVNRSSGDEGLEIPPCER